MITDGNGGTPPIESNVDISSLLSNNGSVVLPTSLEQAPTDIVAPATTVVEPVVPPVVEPAGLFEQTLANFQRTDLSDEDKDAQASLMDFFKATQIDAKGNLLNSAGALVLSADKLKSYLEEDQLPLNTTGDVINDLGEVVRTHAQLLEDNSVVAPLREAMETNFGVSFPADFVLPDTQEGIINLVQETVKQLNRNTVVNFLEAQPEVKGFVQHLALGGTVDNYQSSNINYKGVDVKTLDDTSKLEFLKRSFTLQGNPSPDSLIDLIKKAGEEELNKATKGALDFLDKKQTENNTARDQQVQLQQQEEAQNIKEYWNNVEQVITKGTLNSINIPVTERQAFFDYLARPINDNMESAESLDIQKDSVEFQLLVSYLRYKGGDVSLLAKNIAKQERVQTLSERMNKHRTPNGSGVPSTSGSSSRQTSNLDITTLLGNNK